MYKYSENLFNTLYIEIKYKRHKNALFFLSRTPTISLVTQNSYVG